MEKKYEENDEIQIDLMELFLALKKRIWLLLLAAAAGALASGLYSCLILTPTYTSTSMLYVLSKETTLTSLADLQIGSQLTQDYRVMITSRPVLQEAVETLELDMSYRELRGKLRIENPSDTRILTLVVEDTDPVRAKLLVDQVASTASQYIGDIMEMVPPKLIEDGEVPSAQSSPDVRKNAVMGGIIAAALVCVAIVAQVLFNDCIQTEEDVERYMGLSVLSQIPECEEADAKPRKKEKRRAGGTAKKGGKQNE